MKLKIQISAGLLSLAAGLILFAYYGTRERPAGESATPEAMQLAFRHDLATIAGLVLVFLGIVLALSGAVKHWNGQKNTLTD